LGFYPDNKKLLSSYGRNKIPDEMEAKLGFNDYSINFVDDATLDITN